MHPLGDSRLPGATFNAAMATRAIHGSAERIADDLTRPGIQNGRQINKAAGSSDVGQVSDQTWFGRSGMTFLATSG